MVVDAANNTTNSTIVWESCCYGSLFCRSTSRYRNNSLSHFECRDFVGFEDGEVNTAICVTCTTKLNAGGVFVVLFSLTYGLGIFACCIILGCRKSCPCYKKDEEHKQKKLKKVNESGSGGGGGGVSTVSAAPEVTAAPYASSPAQQAYPNAQLEAGGTPAYPYQPANNVTYPV
ncbi:hypothetical protein SAMD00019534_017880 [Acytostelium subglobosum LB1]|uniref:hypothetical protein n=1 Tax=Acytostelium subglobosum LB1 TaxID=1410327 RepID=UPI0006451065|nr:hypothetical protein SAMD00019534_017880 [Acytostelium subglobosum LB1]GAM18613.1 hypothetical protein SAMD00019534_017880 [Acytostelium subglobosum LB1]|eukprot:XP_012757833.1 hypothetical protein SAMD00019534_017880 [Acytostelium subglobosum LB1]